MLAVRLAFDDELPGGALQPVDGGLGEEWIGHECQPLTRVSVGRQHRGGRVVALDADLIDVRGLDGIEMLECEVVD